MTDEYSAAETADEPSARAGYRSYEVYQRERVGESTNLVNPRDLLAQEYLNDPFTVPAILRENYPCYRDWVGNRFWVTRYDDVTSVFVDDANFESRPLGLTYGDAASGQDMGQRLEIQRDWAEMHDASLDRAVARTLDRIGGAITDTHEPFDLASGLADGFYHTLLELVLGTAPDTIEILDLVGQARAGTGWDEQARVQGLAATSKLRRLVATLLAERRERPAGDLLTSYADLGAGSDDVAATLIEADLQTLPASLANLWCLLLTHEEQFDQVKAEPRLMKFAYLESSRHAPSTITVDRYARHEVERFGRLIPQGALVHLSAAAANRDPRQFADPDTFDVTRKDLCRREPRGQYRADGLPAAITFGHGKPSGLPAVPRDEPRSRYALTRDIAVTVSLALLERFPAIRLAPDAAPSMSLDRLGGTYRCRSLPVLLH